MRNTHLPPSSRACAYQSHKQARHTHATCGWRLRVSLSSTDTLLRQQTPLLFNQLHWLRVCEPLFNAPRFLDLLFQQKGKGNSTMQMQFQLLSEGDEWRSEMPAVSKAWAAWEGKGRGREAWWERWKRRWGVGSQPWYYACVPYFARNPRESAETTQRGSVVTPRTRRTLPSQNSTFVMSCSLAPTDPHVSIGQQHGWPLGLAESHGTRALGVTRPTLQTCESWPLVCAHHTHGDRHTHARTTTESVLFLSQTPLQQPSWPFWAEDGRK